MEGCQDPLAPDEEADRDADANTNASMASDESDDDLLAPATFLYEPKRLSEIHTPQKVLTPANNDLSPITPADEIVQKNKKKKRKLCFSKLVKEKAEQDEIDKKLSKMNEELKEGLENGGIFNMIMHEDLNQTDGDLSDESQDASDLLPQHKKELDKNIQKMNEGFGNDFPDGYPGDILFIYQPCLMDLQPPTYIKEIMGVKKSNSVKSSYYETDPLTDEFLMSGFLIDLVLLKKNIDPCAIDWLLKCICFSSKFEVIEAAYNAIWAFFTSSNMKLEWQFTTDKFVRLLIEMGAKDETLFTSSVLQDLFPLKKDFDHGLARPLDQPLSILFLHRLQTLLKSFCCYLKKNPEHFSISDIMFNVLLGLRLGIAMEVNACTGESEVYIGCAIDMYSFEDWEEEAPKICKNALALTSNHCNRLQLVEVIPGTSRGRELKKLLAVTMLRSIVSSSDVDVSEYRKILRSSAVSTVMDVISRIHTHQETDFHELFSIISFINHCTPEESITAADKRKLENLVGCLRRLNGDIRDPGGYYLNRTKVKDLIIRTLNRLTHICNGLQTQSSLDGFFGEKASNFDQLKFETLQDQPDKIEMPEEDTLGDLSKQDAEDEQKIDVKCETSCSDVSKGSNGSDDDGDDENNVDDYVDDDTDKVGDDADVDEGDSDNKDNDHGRLL